MAFRWLRMALEWLCFWKATLCFHTNRWLCLARAFFRRLSGVARGCGEGCEGAILSGGCHPITVCMTGQGNTGVENCKWLWFVLFRILESTIPGNLWIPDGSRD